jgi:hypothetical protein
MARLSELEHLGQNQVVGIATLHLPEKIGRGREHLKP